LKHRPLATCASRSGKSWQNRPFRRPTSSIKGCGKFKAINDTYGHAAGDKVLIEFAARLKGCMRETDFVATLSGDEFVVLAEGLAGGQADAVLVAEKLLAALGTSFDFEDVEQGISGSIGVAMYEAKRGGRGRLAFFTSKALAA
jgi:diguanylate cyclase (GGDEF)-like protein